MSAFSIIIIVVISVFFVISICCNLILLRKYKSAVSEADELRCEKISVKSKLSMIEYIVREYVETNKNPFTLLRDISNILKE